MTLPTKPPSHKISIKSGFSQMHDHDRWIPDADKMDDLDKKMKRNIWCWFCKCLFYTLFFVFFMAYAILIGVTIASQPIVSFKEMVIETLKVQSGNDSFGEFTDMLFLNSTVRISYRNTHPFCILRVTPDPLYFTYSNLTLASGQIENFSLRKKSEKIIEINVLGNRIPLHGRVPGLYDQQTKPDQVVLPLNITFESWTRIPSFRAKYRFYRCSITFHGDKLGKILDLSKSCS